MNQEHYDKLKEGVEAWNAWREDNPRVVPDLQGAVLRKADFRISFPEDFTVPGAGRYAETLPKAVLKGARLRGVDMHRANLKNADLSGLFV